MESSPVAHVEKTEHDRNVRQSHKDLERLGRL